MKSVFLNSDLKEEVYIEQFPRFTDPKFYDHVYKLSKALNELKQAPKAWYEKLSSFLVKKGYRREKIYTTLFLNEQEGDLLVVQSYMDAIIVAVDIKLCLA